jgi:hypothetical protein
MNKASQTSDLFSMIFGNEPSNISGGESPAQTHNRMPAVSTAPVAWGDDQFPTPNIMGGLETLCFATGINGRVGEPSSSMDVLDGQCDNSMDSGDIWWGGGQDVFFTAGDVQVPLYGLMEPT